MSPRPKAAHSDRVKLMDLSYIYGVAQKVELVRIRATSPGLIALAANRLHVAAELRITAVPLVLAVAGAAVIVLVAAVPAAPAGLVPAPVPAALVVPSPRAPPLRPGLRLVVAVIRATVEGVRCRPLFDLLAVGATLAVVLRACVLARALALTFALALALALILARTGRAPASRTPLRSRPKDLEIGARGPLVRWNLGFSLDLGRDSTNFAHFGASGVLAVRGCPAATCEGRPRHRQAPGQALRPASLWLEPSRPRVLDSRGQHHGQTAHTSPNADGQPRNRECSRKLLQVMCHCPLRVPTPNPANQLQIVGLLIQPSDATRTDARRDESGRIGRIDPQGPQNGIPLDAKTAGPLLLVPVRTP